MSDAAALRPLGADALLATHAAGEPRPRTPFVASIPRMALADFQERSRRVVFLVTLIAAVWAAHVFLPPNHAQYATLQIARHRGLYNSEWVGALIAMLANVFMGFAGFYLTKNAVDRDRQTRVGDVLAATTMSRPLYTLSKALSNFMVLAGMVVVLGASACVLQLMRGEDLALRPLSIALPLLWITLPFMAVIASLGVLFETIPLLRGGLGNVVYFFLWISGLAGSSFGSKAGAHPMNEPSGLTVLMPEMIRACARAFPHEIIDGSRMSMGFSVLDKGQHWDITTFVWPGVAWTPALIAGRMLWVVVAIAIALLAALPFDRFERDRPWSARGWLGRLWRGGASARAPGAAGTGLADLATVFGTAGSSAIASSSADPTSRRTYGETGGALALFGTRATRRGSGLGALVLAELRLALKGLPLMWWMATSGLVIAALVTPLAGARSVVAAFAWVWPVLVWSQLGTREARHGTAQIMASSPRPLDRQLAAAWLAGVLVSLFAGLPLTLRFMFASEWSAVATACGGMLLVPAVALACGGLTGNARLFEVLFLLTWYAGVLNRLAGADVSGGSIMPGDFGPARGFAVATVVFLAIARAARARRLQD